MEYTIDMADICELAHYLTKVKCIAKNIPVPKDNEEEYSKRAQVIFDYYLDVITEKLGV